MGARIRGVAVVVVVLAVGAFLGSTVRQVVAPGAIKAPEEDPAGAGREADGAIPAERVRVEVLNGSGRGGVAQEATDYLRDSGFDVVYFGNADHFGYEASAVIDRVGRPDLARAVARAMGIVNVRSEPDSTRYLDVSVVLGQEWHEPPEVPGVSEGASFRAWWDLRRLFDDHERPAGPPGSPGPPGRMADPGNDEG